MPDVWFRLTRMLLEPAIYFPAVDGTKANVEKLGEDAVWGETLVLASASALESG